MFFMLLFGNFIVFMTHSDYLSLPFVSPSHPTILPPAHPNRHFPKLMTFGSVCDRPI